MRKKCLWCEERLVSMFGKYDEDSNTCEVCLEKSLAKDANVYTYGSWTRQTEVEKNAHSKDILQPLKKDGTVNKHFVEAHGTKALEKEFKASKREIMKEVEKYG